MPSPHDVVIVSARRSPIGKFLGSLSNLSASELGATVLKQTLKDIPALSASASTLAQIDEIIVGQVLQAGTGQNPARQTAIKAGIPESVPSYTINKVCGSGLKAIGLAAQSIKTGDAKIVIAGGQESMSKAPHVVQMRKGQKMGPVGMVDSMVHDGLTCAFNHYHMGITAENVVQKYNLTRQQQDEFALSSQKKAIQAQQDGKFKQQIVPIPTNDKKNPTLDKDEYINTKATEEGMKKLKPAFKKDGSVTAGNASGLNDGAAFCVLMTREKAVELKCPVLAVVKGFAAAGVDPKLMGLGPIPASKKLLEKVGV